MDPENVDPGFVDSESVDLGSSKSGVEEPEWMTGVERSKGFEYGGRRGV